MVDKATIIAILADFEHETHKSAALFAALKMDELTDKWSILLAAEWVNEANQRDTYKSLIRSIARAIDFETISSIARVGILNSEEHLANLIINKYDGFHHIQEDDKINGNIIHEGYIVVRRKETTQPLPLTNP